MSDKPITMPSMVRAIQTCIAFADHRAAICAREGRQGALFEAELIANHFRAMVGEEPSFRASMVLVPKPPEAA